MKVIDVKTFAVDCFRTNWMFVKVYTDEVFLDVLDRADERLFLVFEGRLAHTGHALVGVDLDEHPVGAEAVNSEYLYVGYFHILLLK